MTDDRFCAFCGSPLQISDCYCPKCGAATHQVSKQDTVKRYCLIITHSKKLSLELGGIDPNIIIGLIEKYTSRMRMSGVKYSIIDLAQYGQDISLNDVIAIIEDVKNRRTSISSLFIIGSDFVVPMARYDDPTETDEDIESDFCYSILNTASPWKAKLPDTAYWLQVGRLPTYRGGASTLFQYLDRAATWRTVNEDLQSFCLSAEVWKKTSQVILSSFGAGEPLLSPDAGPEDVAELLPSESALLHFNLHGSANLESAEWYGQRGSGYPTAFVPELLSRQHGYMLACEACYGARFNGFEKRNSGLLCAIDGGCLAFLGSSRIAFGASNGSLLGADVMTSVFLSNISKGASSGSAFQAARESILAGNVREIELKTLLEFNLFGDPELRMRTSFETKARNASLKVEFPDVRQITFSRLSDLSKEMKIKLDDYLMQFHQNMLDVMPRIYSRGINDENLVIYEDVRGRVPQVLVLVTGENNSILTEYTSK